MIVLCMRTASLLLPPIDRLIEALVDPARRDRAVGGVLAAYVAVWTLYGVLAKASQDINYDAAGMVAWSRELALGYPVHPPLGPWLVRAWFELFPSADWSYYLLAILSATLSLWAAWRVYAGFLDGVKCVAALALLTLVPFYNFHALKFDHNALLVPLWALTTWWFIRSFETRGIGWAALAGLGAAAAMLGKYWSIFLLAGLGLAALTDPRRGDYFRSRAPWITFVVGTLGLIPHIAWLATHDFSTLVYPIAAHGRELATELAVSVLRYFTSVGYVALPVLLTIAATRPSSAAIADAIRPRAPERMFASVIFWTPLLLPGLIAPFLGISLSPIWTTPAMTLLPVILLSSPLISISRAAVRCVVAIAVALPLVATAVSPVIAIVTHRLGVTGTAAHGRLVAERVAEEWRKTTDRPLRLLGGAADLANVMAFYLPDRPSVFAPFEPDVAPWVDPARVARHGIAMACDARLPLCLGAAATDPACYASGPICVHDPVLREIAAVESKGPVGRRVVVGIARTYFGVVGPPALYIIVTVPPRP